MARRLLNQYRHTATLWLPLLLGVTFSGASYAESSNATAAAEFVLEVQGQKDHALSIKAAREQWEKDRLLQMQTQTKQRKSTPANLDELYKREASKIIFPKPGTDESSDASDVLGTDWLARLTPVAALLLPAKAEAAGVFGGIAIDGNVNDWAVTDRINWPIDRPPYMATGPELYAKYVPDTAPQYVFAVKAPGVAIGPNTTLWLNTDQNAATGYKIWGTFGGDEYAVNIYSDGVPHLYKVDTAGVFTWVTALNYATSTDKSVIEFVVPATALGLSTPQAIDLLGDINDSVFLPTVYDPAVYYTVPAVATTYPVRTDASKRVGIVFSTSSKNHFYDSKAYSQLFMSMQHQAMMAGIGFDLLNETDLTDLNKLVNYDALIFPYAANIPKNIRSAVNKNLFTAIYQYGIGIISADNFMTNDELNAVAPGDAYAVMRQLLGITRDNGAGPVSVDLTANAVTHPAMKGYVAGESILSSQALNAYKSTWTSYFQAIPGQAADTLANQTIGGVGTKPGVIANTTGGRNVHFATAALMADGPLVWQALQWVVYGTQTPVALKMGRNNNLFISRNDMDQSQEYGHSYFDDMGNVDVPLYSLLNNWKTTYNFVGSYYINIGNAPPDQQTIWLSNPPSTYDSKPLYQKYIALSNEIGTHSYTHPHDTNALTPTQIEFEFNQSMNQIATNLNPTWNNQAIRGAAVPGMPESVATAQSILQHVDYLSGGGSMIGAGYPSAIGYLTAADTKVYFSPNMSFDFTLMDFGVPQGTPPVPTRLNATQAEAYWAAEYDRLMKHAAQPIIHWPWHDYGPTSATTAASGQGYTLAMFQNTIAKAYNNGAEFATLADVAQRINTFKNAKLTVTQAGTQYTANVAANNVGKFSLAMNLPAGQKIQRVSNWYAYNDNSVFLDDDGGTFVVQAGTVADAVTHITEMPMRSKLISLSGDGANLDMRFEGEGSVKVILSDAANKFQITSDGGVLTTTGNTASIKFATVGTHTLAVKLSPVTVYRNTAFGGVSQIFQIGTYSFAAGQLNVIGDNTISSLKVASGYSLLACENSNATGICKTYTADNSNIATATANLNDKISYLKVSKL